MAPLPPFLVRLATVYLTPVLTAALTRRLAQSPTFLRAVDRMIHHIDHFPNRLEGKPVPPYRGPAPGSPAAGNLTAKGMKEWAEEWRQEDPGEPHDWQSPFPQQQQPQQQPASQEPHQRSSSAEQSSRRAAAASTTQQPQQAAETPQEKWQREMRDLQEKLRGGAGGGSAGGTGADAKGKSKT